MPIRFSIKAIPPFNSSRRTVCGISRCIYLSCHHSIVTTTTTATTTTTTTTTTTRSFSTETPPPQPTKEEVPVPAAQPSWEKQSDQYSWKVNQGIRRRRRTVPQLCPVNAHRVTPYKLVKLYTSKLDRGYPFQIRNLPGFLDEQAWFDHKVDNDGTFKSSHNFQVDDLQPGFDILKAILASAITGHTHQTTGPGSSDIEPANIRSLFDDYKAACKISRLLLQGDSPPLLKFRDWLEQSQFKDYELHKAIDKVQKAYEAKQHPWIPFNAPLVFFRAAYQYNRDHGVPAAQTMPPQDNGMVHDQNRVKIPPECIVGLSGLVGFTDKITEEFPFPRIIQDIRKATYQSSTCNVRVGIRPLGSSMRRYKNSTVVVGQLAGYSIVTMVPPQLKALNGQPLEFHERVRSTWERSTSHGPYRSPSFFLPNSVWTREFEEELTASGDILLASLIPGDGLLVPEGWWYRVRSINNGAQLHATVTWFLNRDGALVENQEEDGAAKYLEKSETWIRV
ncbi:hypothetical protein F5Y10DRAFT_235200 [Nemania abortiva]|nr:hypothetical protein F5Y10DRAFT_235200 [Nemania abortiva]